jgi:hypothetical protein
MLLIPAACSQITFPSCPRLHGCSLSGAVAFCHLLSAVVVVGAVLHDVIVLPVSSTPAVCHFINNLGLSLVWTSISRGLAVPYCFPALAYSFRAGGGVEGLGLGCEFPPVVRGIYPYSWVR